MTRRIESGETLHNPVTGERAIVLEAPAERADGGVVVELRLDPGAAVVGEHLHPATEEVFEVLSGRLGYRLDGAEATAVAGDRIEIAAGHWHDWWHEGEDETVIRVTVVPGERFAQMIRTIWGLACDGLTDERGMPTALQLATFAGEFSDVMVMRRPPRIVQRAVFALLAPIARRRGYRGTYPRYEEMGSVGSAEEVRAGRPSTPEFGAGPGPPDRPKANPRG